VPETLRMSSRPKYFLCGVGALVVLLLVLAILEAPPDGVERGETSQFVGRFHPLAVHLPIALLLLVAVLELAGLVPSGRHLKPAAGFVLALAAAGLEATKARSSPATCGAGFCWRRRSSSVV